MKMKFFFLALPAVFLSGLVSCQDEQKSNDDKVKYERVEYNSLCARLADDTLIGVEKQVREIQEKEVLRNHTFVFEGVKEAFNPSIVKIPNGYLMSARFDCRCTASTEHQSYNLVFELSENLDLIGPARVLSIPRPVDGQKGLHTFSSQSQDLRLFLYQGGVFAAYNDVDDGVTFDLWNTRKMYAVALYKENGRWLAKNPILFESPINHERYDQREKNWVPFESQNNELMFGYYVDPHVVLNFGSVVAGETRKTNISMEGATLKSPKIGFESLGSLRGGTPAIYLPMEDGYISFYHSVNKVKDGARTSYSYGFGAYIFDSKNYGIKKLSPQLITFSGMYDGEKSYWVKQIHGQVIFPSGLERAVFSGKPVFLVANGKNDTSANLLELDEELVLSGLVSIK